MTIPVEHPDACAGQRMPEATALGPQRFVKRLTESGFTVWRAETLAEAYAPLHSTDLATQKDLAGIEAGVLEWLMDALVAQGGLIVTLVKLLQASGRRSWRRSSGCGCTKTGIA